jgi:DNA-directed RNA polymerase specialized sigma24 family protein
MDLLPRDAELARRAAGGDGAAFVRLYDRYSTDVFATSLAATGSVDSAAEATQTAFLRILRWPPRHGAPDGDVVELLYALALGGPHEWVSANPEATDHKVARLVGVGWLRSETVSKAGARFDADWSVHLWSPSDAEEAEPEPEPVDEAPARRRRFLPRLRLGAPSPATAATALFLFLSGISGTLLIGGDRADPLDAAPASATGDRMDEGPQPSQRERAELRESQKRKRSGQD